jgi:hypothetical protein
MVLPKDRFSCAVQATNKNERVGYDGQSVAPHETPTKVLLVWQQREHRRIDRAEKMEARDRLADDASRRGRKSTGVVHW